MPKQSKQSTPSGKKGEEAGNPEKPEVWAKLFPDKEYPVGCEFLEGPDFLDWLSKMGFSFHNSTIHNPVLDKAKCIMCSKQYSGNISSTSVINHLLSAHKKHLKIENIGLFFDGKKIGEIYRPDFVLICEGHKTSMVFENKNGDKKEGGSVEEKPAASNYKQRHYTAVFEMLGYQLDRYVYTVHGERYKRILANSKFRSQAEDCVRTGEKLLFFNFEDGHRIES